MIVESPFRAKRVSENIRREPKKKTVFGRVSSGNHNNGIPEATRLPELKPGRILLFVIITGILGFLYLSHVFATQKLLKENQRVERLHQNAMRHHDNLQLRYDRLVGPAEVYSKAKEIGLINGGPADAVIHTQE